MRRAIGMDIHRTFGEVVIWENGLTRHEGRVDMTHTALEGFGGQLLKTDEVVIEATGNCMAVSRVLSPHVARVVIADPLQVKAIAHAHVKTDKVDAATLASLYAAGSLPEIWTPDAATERMRRLVARRYQVVRHRTRIKNEVHAILHAHLIPKCPHADLFNRRGRDWQARQPVPKDEQAAIARQIRELDRLAEDLAVLDREIAQDALENKSIQRLLTITGVNPAVAAGLMAAIGSIDRFRSRPSLVAHKRRAMELAAGQPQKKGNRRGASYAYNVRELRRQEMKVAEHAEKSYEHFVAAWKPRPPRTESRCATASNRQGLNRLPDDASSRRATLRHEVDRTMEK